MKRLLSLTLLLSLLAPVCLEAQNPPSTDIHVFDLKEQKRRVKITNGKNVTDRDGYDNQPFFMATDKLLYTSQRDGQTDIYMINLTDGSSKNLTNTPESEYSAYMLSRSNNFVVVRVEADGKQRLWQFDANGEASPKLVFEDIEPVGYHAWAATEVAMFVLGDPATLVMNSTKVPNQRTITDNIGRTIKTRGRNFIIQRNEENGNNIYQIAGRTGKLRKITTLPRDATDWTVTPQGSFITSVGSKIFKLNPEFDSAWSEIADLDAQGVNKITRIAVSADNTKIAMVIDR